MKVRHILSVEDNEADFELLKKFLTSNQKSMDLKRAGDGEEALDYVFARRKYTESVRPDLILLDLNLPKIDGREVLKELKSHPKFKSIPIIVFTSSELDSDVDRCYELHANSYFVKPFDLNQFELTIKAICDYWIGHAKISPKSGIRAF